MLFLIDGYNVTCSDPATRDLTLEDQREALVRRLRARSGVMLGAGRVVILFDAAQGAGRGHADTSPVRVVYAREGTADDAIVRAVRGVNEKIVVITDDRELAERVRTHARGEVEVRASVVCHEDSGTGSARKGRRPAPRRDAGLPDGANKITEELKKLWLDEEDE